MLIVILLFVSHVLPQACRGVTVGCSCHACDAQEEPVQEPPQQEYAVDQWIIEFANLFREHTGEHPALCQACFTHCPVTDSALHQHITYVYAMGVFIILGTCAETCACAWERQQWVALL